MAKNDENRRYFDRSTRYSTLNFYFFFVLLKGFEPQTTSDHQGILKF